MNGTVKRGFITSCCIIANFVRIISGKKSVFLVALAVIWLLSAGLGLWMFSSREFKPDAAGSPKASWPADTTLQRQAGGFTLVIVVHPECPCSQATLGELDAIMAQSAGRLKAEVLCVDYAGLPEPVAESRIWRRAARIPGVAVTRDLDGMEAHRFAARTSGEVRLYGPDGALRFHGGITSARGHSGANPGSTAVMDIVLGRPGAHPPGSTPVFGCSL